MRAKCGFDPATGNARGLLVTVGPTLAVDIGFDPNFTPSSQDIPALAMKGVAALVDTGATESCIDSDLAMQLNLPIIDQRPCGGVAGIAMLNMHLAQIHIPSLNFTVFGQFAGVNLQAGGQPHVALIGRTFLHHFRMIYCGISGEVMILTEEEPLTL